MDGLDIFPANGLDRSIMTPVLVGVAIMVWTSEALGWPFAGLVVPGYLASVFLVAPVTGLAILAESVGAYAIARAIGVWLPNIEAWSQAFGRERFFLVIVASLVVRIFSEGYALPALSEHYGFTQASELYSIGLVLIPLVANSAWNVGLWRGSVQMLLISLGTYLVLQFVLLPYTNLSLSKVELTFERIAIDFLSSPKAYLVLVVGTIAAARFNVLYGWDYNGILVPGLLAVAWYTPTKLAATLIEATVVTLLSQKLVTTPLFHGRLIEGPRRLLLVFCVGFLLKWVMGGVLMGFWPSVTATDFYGFGYVLPTLLSMKMWQYRSIPHVLMPTLTVSLVGFLGGNVLGLGLQLVLPPPREEAVIAKSRERGSLELELLLQAELPERRAPALSAERQRLLMAAIASDLARHDSGAAMRRAGDAQVELLPLRVDGLGITFVLRDEHSAGYVPAMALREQGFGGLIVRGEDPLELAALSVPLAKQLGVAWWVLMPDRVGDSGRWLSDLLEVMPRSPVRSARIGETITLSDLTSVDKSRLRQRDFELNEREELVYDAATKQVLLQRALPLAPPGEPLAWGEADTQLPRPPEGSGTAERVLRSRLRLFSNRVVPALDDWADGKDLSASASRILYQLGMSLHPVVGVRGDALAIRMDKPEVTGASLLWLVRRTPSKSVMAAPFTLEQRATAKVAKPLARTFEVRHFILGETRPPRTQDAILRGVVRRTYLGRALEILLTRGATITVVQGLPQDPELEQNDIVLSSSLDVADPPAWLLPYAEKLGSVGLSVRPYVGDRATASARGSAMPWVEFSRALYSDRTAVIAITERMRQRYVVSSLDRLPTWLAFDGMRREQDDLVERLLTLPARGASCDLKQVRQSLIQVHSSANPVHAQRVRQLSASCGALVIDDLPSGEPFLIGISGRTRWVFSLLRSPTEPPYVAKGSQAVRDAADFGYRYIELPEEDP